MPTVHNPKRPWIKTNPKPALKHQGGLRANRPIYDNQRHRNLRKLHLQENPLCVMCKKAGRLTEATVYDHIVPVNQGGDPWDESNKQGLCVSCHAKKRQTEKGYGKGSR